ncbi:YncE family protein [Bradymonas sediminis]|uniref:Uncharacterized protein n=1 Tax=Bradymonas sediminis TaxID=1548548 RepID=A0A2Z4FN90_9DELT|nr:hypothetical protein [Bradymonas sediminis]AWV90245.1 hypothetical protein DN745_13265 [Bradymonas sediminis]TDP75786.1 hypothetical protein DFR33_103125 [Bradymonas sediminis]
MTKYRRKFSKLGTVLALAALVGAGACSSDSAGDFASETPNTGGGGAQNNDWGSGDEQGSWDAGTGADDDFVPEQEEDFEFSAPAVVGEQVYVANETLNSVAVIDSRNLSITTRQVGFRPTGIVGPDAERAEPSDDARVMVLNEGSNSVSILETGDAAVSPESVHTVKVMANANRIAMEPTGESAVVWYDPASAEAGDAAGDLSSVSVVRNGKSFQISVGFHVRSVAFDDAGTRALILTDDGLSVIELAQVDGDSIALPMQVVPEQFSSTQPEDLEVLMTRDGKWAITRSATFSGVVLMDIDADTLHFMALPEIPTDIDLIEGDELEVLIMLRNAGKAVRASVPDGFRDAAAALNVVVEPVVLGFSQDIGYDGGVPDVGYDVGGPDVEYDIGFPDDIGGDWDAGDVGYPDDSGYEDVYDPDVSYPVDSGYQDVYDPDIIEADGGPGEDPDAGWQGDVSSGSGDVFEGDASANSDAGSSDDGADFPTGIDGFSVVDLVVDGMGAAVVSASGDTALLYSTLNQEKRAVLYDLSADSGEDAQRALAFEKGVRGALSDKSGNTLLVFHSKLDGPVPPNASPADPEYIEHSWGVSVVDVASSATRLVLSKKEPGQAVLSTPELDANGDAAEDAKIFMIFKAPLSAQDSDSEYRDVLTVNLRSFRTDSFRVPSVPEGLGLIREAGRVYISQRHPQGRMTFVDVVSESRQTVTGYQLNAGIE